MEEWKLTVNDELGAAFAGLGGLFGLAYLCYQRSGRGAFLRGFLDEPGWTPPCGWTSRNGLALEVRLTEALADGLERMLDDSADGQELRDADGRLRYDRCVWLLGDRYGRTMLWRGRHVCDLMRRVQEAVLSIGQDMDRALQMADDADARGDGTRATSLRAEARALGSVLGTISWCGIPIMIPLECGDEGGER